MNHQLIMNLANEPQREIYTYLGKCNNAYFFVHFVDNLTSYKPDISYHIYDILVKDTVITNIYEYIVIYEFCGDDVITLVFYNQLVSQPELCKNNLEQLFRQMLFLQRTNLYVINYLYGMNKYIRTNIVDTGSFASDLTIPEEDVIIDNIYYVSKQI